MVSVRHVFTGDPGPVPSQWNKFIYISHMTLMVCELVTYRLWLQRFLLALWFRAGHRIVLHHNHYHYYFLSTRIWSHRVTLVAVLPKFSKQKSWDGGGLLVICTPGFPPHPCIKKSISPVYVCIFGFLVKFYLRKGVHSDNFLKIVVLSV